ncbi:MAG: hypothetical protein JRI91_14225 [Deltaproteobacteria bacterium]|nr:hypothetical protein [Deltaproteobacteria bacterium]
MTSIGSLLWIVAIGALFFMMTRKGGGGCGGGHDEGHGSPKKELGHSQGDDKNQHKGGCCG